MGVKKRAAVVLIIISLWCLISGHLLERTAHAREEQSFELEPRIVDGQALIPLRKVFETMGYRVEWEGQMRRITILGQEYLVVLYLDSELYSINGAVKRMEQRLVVENGSSLVSLDFFQELAVADNIIWDHQQIKLTIYYSKGEPALNGWLDNDQEGRYANFIEVRLPSGEQVEIGQTFDIHVGAPFIPGIHTYEVRLFYDPERLLVLDILNPDFRSGQDYYKKTVNNNEGQVSYAQAVLGYRTGIPSRRILLTIRAEALKQGKVPLLENTLSVVILDNEARKIPISQEEVTLFIASPEGEHVLD